ncbi:TetR/AcrR family transcriptional regulator [Microbacterium sp. NPDC089695]|uniref:TetR/AcrR family transcriptional regulator n=1 Tax=Microbacterium sp. NPDC089695 TaxID=3364198 RepID=UPI0038267549
MNDDPRHARTRTALGDALLRLLASAPLDAITVASLCREAGVHRTTFYGHAAGVEEFAVEFLTRDLDAVATVDPEQGGIDLQRYRTALVTILEHVAAERTLYRSLLQSRWAGSLRAAIDARLRGRFILALDVFASTGAASVPARRDEVAAFLSGALVGAIDVWSAGEDTDARAGADRILALMPTWWPLQPDEDPAR